MSGTTRTSVHSVGTDNGATVVDYTVGTTRYQLRRDSGKHNPIEAFVKNKGKLDPIKVSQLPNTELVEEILREVFEIDSIEAMEKARSKVDGIMAIPLPERKFAHH